MILYIPLVQERGEQNAGFIPWSRGQQIPSQGIFTKIIGLTGLSDCILLSIYKVLHGLNVLGNEHTASEHTILISKHWYRLKMMQIPSYWFISAMKWFDGSIGLSSQLILFRWTLSNSNVFFMLIIFDQWRNEYCGPIGFRATKWDSSHFKPSKVLRI